MLEGEGSQGREGGREGGSIKYLLDQAMRGVAAETRDRQAVNSTSAADNRSTLFLPVAMTQSLTSSA